MGKVNEERRCAIQHLSRAGLNQNQIAKRLGCSRQNINEMVNNPPTGKKGGRSPNYSPEIRAEVDRLMYEGLTLYEIAERLEIPKGTIWHMANRLGWKRIWAKEE